MADKPSLSDFTYFANRSAGGVTDPSSARAQAALAAVQQFDPSAAYTPTFGSDGQLIGYDLDFDASKLPGASGGALGPTSGHGSGAGFMPFFSTVQPNMHLSNPNLVTDSSAYGRITPNTNIKQDDDIWSVLGPLAVLGFGFAAPAMFGAYSTLGGAAAGSSGLDGSLLPMMPTDEASLYTPMLPFNAADPSLAINGITPAEALGGAGVAGSMGAGTQAAAPITDLSTQASPLTLLRNSPVGDALHALGSLAKTPGLGGHAGGGGLLGGARAGVPFDDLTTILRRFYLGKGGLL